METTTFEIVTAKSNIDWTGRKVTGAHNGTINIKEGRFLFTEGQLTGGNVIIDTTSIKILDIADPDTNAQFAGHLASDDFFSIEKFPTAAFETTAAKQNPNGRYLLEGNLTIKGITHPAKLEAEVNSTGGTLTLSGKLTLDRTLYGIKFRSGNFFKDLGDTLIYNDFELDIDITAKNTSTEILNN
ncbi:YceI family protein [Flavobacterium humi]|uniref:YceI family protein n=1 Tax=Flavobacterium humi TaxID=2562683 RepID=A0A4Z0L6J3_9FLAO|nr:YceI family protein [Flavobacterium humi]TGD56594.1 YceI family protein [Flavobacterium humi]